MSNSDFVEAIKLTGGANDVFLIYEGEQKIIRKFPTINSLRHFSQLIKKCNAIYRKSIPSDVYIESSTMYERNEREELTNKL